MTKNSHYVILLYDILNLQYHVDADVVELADALVLGTSANGVGVRVPSSAPKVDVLELVKSIAISEFK